MAEKMRKETKIVLWILGLGALLTTGLVIGAILLLSDEDVMADAEPRWLYLDLRVPLSEMPQPMGILDDPDSLPPITTEMASIIRTAGEDEQILGIRAELGGLNLGWAQVEELRNALLDFETREKNAKYGAKAIPTKNITWPRHATRSWHLKRVSFWSPDCQ